MEETDNINNLLTLLIESKNSNICEHLKNIKLQNQKNIQIELSKIINESDFTSAIADVGMPTEKSFFSELLNRLNTHFFSKIYPANDFRRILNSRVKNVKISKWLNQLTNDEANSLLKWLIDDSVETLPILQKKLNRPFKVLVTRLTYYGTSRQIQEKIYHDSSLRDGFFEAEKNAGLFIKSSTLASYNSLQASLNKCLNVCEKIRSEKSEHGISLDITFRIIKIKEIVNRLDTLARLKLCTTTDSLNAELAPFVKLIANASVQSGKVLQLITEYTELVFYEITEHSGKKGEKYTRSRKKDYLDMLAKGSLGGVIVGLLAFFKPMFSEFGLAPAGQFLAYGSIYSIIFLLIYFLKGVLATKQPSMTASRIAQVIDQDVIISQQSKPHKLVGVIRDIFRIQFIAIMANFVVALPVAAASYFILTEYNIYSLKSETSKYLITSLHPVFSPTIVFAIITGVCLALSGIFAGAFKNWYIFNQVKRRILLTTAYLSTRKRERFEKTLNFVDKHLDGLSSNVSLGFLLGFVSALGNTFGLGLDVRHITFASAQVGIGIVQQYGQFTWQAIVLILFSVLLIGVINLLVSFNITLLIALRSRGITFKQFIVLFRSCRQDFFQNPLSYFFPSKTQPESEA